MKRVRRWLFNGLAAVSAVLFVGVCLLWARSRGHQTGDTLFVQTKPGRYYAVMTGQGGIGFDCTIVEHPAELRRFGVGTSYSLHYCHQNFFYPPVSARQRLGFDYFDGELGDTTDRIIGSGTFRTVVLPSWLFAAAFALLPATVLPALLRGLVRWRQPCRGCCPVCGYDLRATPYRCPECGEPIPSTSGRL